MQPHKFVQRFQRQSGTIPAAPADAIHFTQFHKTEIRVGKVVKIGIQNHNRIIKDLTAALDHFAQTGCAVQDLPQRILPPVKAVIDTADQIECVGTVDIGTNLNHIAFFLISRQINAVPQQKNQCIWIDPGSDGKILRFHQVHMIRSEPILPFFIEFRAQKMQRGGFLPIIDSVPFLRQIVKDQIGIQFHTHLRIVGF